MARLHRVVMAAFTITATVAAATVASVVTTSLTSAPASAATVTPGTNYVFVNRNSGKAMDLWEWSTADGAPINQFTRNDLAVQQWQFVDVGSGYYQIRSTHSGKVLEVPDATDGAQLVQRSSSSGNTRQHFRLADSSGGYVRFISRHSSKAVEVWEWSTADGAHVVQY